MLSVLLVAPLAHRRRVHRLGLFLLDQIRLLLTRLCHLAEDRRVQLLLLLLGILALPPNQRDLILGGRVLGVNLQELEWKGIERERD